jgi:hypothetical protein
MSGQHTDYPELAKWDPTFTKQLVNLGAPIVKRWFRAEV